MLFKTGILLLARNVTEDQRYGQQKASPEMPAVAAAMEPEVVRLQFKRVLAEILEERTLTRLKTACVRTQVSVHLHNYIFKPNLLLPLQCRGGMEANTLLRGAHCF